MTTLARSLSLICAIVGLGGCASAPISSPSRSAWVNECYRSYEHDVTFVSGPDALDCGLLPRKFDSSEQDSIRQCAQRAVLTGKPFRAGYASHGDDSLYCDAVVRSESGQLWSVYYDADVSGGGGGRPHPALWVSRCTDLVFEPGTIGAGSYFKLAGCSEDKEIVSRIVADRKAQKR